jgi:hypothetical protein
MPDEIVDETEPELDEGFFLPLRLKYEYVTGEHWLLSVRVSPTSFGLTASGCGSSMTVRSKSNSRSRSNERGTTSSPPPVSSPSRHRNWGLGLTAQDPDFHVVRIRTSSSFVLPVVQYMRPNGTLSTARSTRGGRR